MPTASFTHSAVTSAARSDVWGRLQDAETWAAIGPIERVWDAIHDDGQLSAFRWQTTVGPTSFRGAAVVAADPPNSMTIDLDATEVKGRLVTRLDDAASGTRVEVTLEVAPQGMMSTMFFPAISQAIGRGLPEHVDGFVDSLTD